MRLVKSIQIMSAVTILSLIYTHLQMQIFDYAYQGKKQEKEITHLKGENGYVLYNIMQLKSSLHLGVKLLSDNSDFQFSDNDNIVKLVTTESFEVENREPLSQNEPVNSLLSFLTVKSEAEARSLEKSRVIRPWRKAR